MLLDPHVFLVFLGTDNSEPKIYLIDQLYPLVDDLDLSIAIHSLDIFQVRILQLLFIEFSLKLIWILLLVSNVTNRMFLDISIQSYAIFLITYIIPGHIQNSIKEKRRQARRRPFSLLIFLSLSCQMLLKTKFSFPGLLFHVILLQLFI